MEMEEQVSEQAEQAVESREIPADLPTYFADGIGAAMGLYSYTLIFLQSRPPAIGLRGTPADPQPQPVCMVQMSPEQAKVLGALVVEAVRNYEKDRNVEIATDGTRTEPMERLYGPWD